MHVRLCTLYKIKLIRQRKSKDMFFLQIGFRLFKSEAVTSEKPYVDGLIDETFAMYFFFTISIINLIFF